MPRLAAWITNSGFGSWTSATTGQEASWTICSISSSACSRALAETDERNIGLFTRGHRPNFGDLDLGSDHVVPEVGDEVYDLR